MLKKLNEYVCVDHGQKLNFIKKLLKLSLKKFICFNKINIYYDNKAQDHTLIYFKCIKNS